MQHLLQFRGALLHFFYLNVFIQVFLSILIFDFFFFLPRQYNSSILFTFQNTADNLREVMLQILMLSFELASCTRSLRNSGKNVRQSLYEAWKNLGEINEIKSRRRSSLSKREREQRSLVVIHVKILRSGAKISLVWIWLCIISR